MNRLTPNVLGRIEVVRIFLRILLIELFDPGSETLADSSTRVFVPPSNAQLILLLANHIGDLAVLREALAAARLALPTTAT